MGAGRDQILPYIKSIHCVCKNAPTQQKKPRLVSLLTSCNAERDYARVTKNTIRDWWRSTLRRIQVDLIVSAQNILICSMPCKTVLTHAQVCESSRLPNDERQKEKF